LAVAAAATADAGRLTRRRGHRRRRAEMRFLLFPSLLLLFSTNKIINTNFVCCGTVEFFKAVLTLSTAEPARVS
jgi:hypothetical protein